MKMKKEELSNKKPADSCPPNSSTAHHVGNKVLPISSEATALPPRVKGDNKAKAISRMKDLIRWAAATKSDMNGKLLARRVLHQFRNRGAVKAMMHDSDPIGKHDSHIDSPRFSLRWEVGSSSPACSTLSMASCPAAVQDRKAGWITTDSDFVVLEL